MTNIAGKAYAINAATPMPPSKTWITRLVFALTRALKDSLAPLLGLGLIHFARWVIIRRDQWPQLGQPPHDLAHDYMLFSSNFNGTWDQYVDAFSDSLASGLNLIWYTSIRWPQSIPVTPFKNYIRANQIDTNYYYNATPGTGQRGIKLALKLEHALIDIEQRMGTLSDEELAVEFERVLRANQAGLGMPGYAPVASLATEASDRNRARSLGGETGSSVDGEHKPHPVPSSTIRTSSAGEDRAERARVSAVVDEALGTPSRTHEAPDLGRDTSAKGGEDA